MRVSAAILATSDCGFGASFVFAGARATLDLGFRAGRLAPRLGAAFVFAFAAGLTLVFVFAALVVFGLGLAATFGLGAALALRFGALGLLAVFAVRALRALRAVLADGLPLFEVVAMMLCAPVPPPVPAAF